MQHHKKILLELRRLLELLFVRKSLREIRCRDYGEEDIPRCRKKLMTFHPGFPLVVVNCSLRCHNLEAAVNVVELLKKDHLLLPPINPFRSEVVQTMDLGCLVHSNLRVLPSTLWCLL